MSKSAFVKAGCRHCGGHIEFLAAFAGQTTPCPHCGQLTVLEGLPLVAEGRRIKWPIVAAVLIVAMGLAILAQRQSPLVLRAPMAEVKVSTNQAAIHSIAPRQMVAPEITVAAPEAPPFAETNGFAVMSFQLQPNAGSSLVYVVGSVRNRTPRQRFGVKVAFGLFDTNDAPVGVATDYQSVIGPHAEWRFKAMVMASTAAVARFQSIVDDQ